MPIKVKQRIVSNEGAKISLENGRVLDLHRFVLAGKRDAVVFGRKGRVSVVLPKNMGNITISPRVWRCQLTLSIFGRKMTVVVKEIENAKEMDGYKALMRHHYRNGVGATRRAPLVAKIKSPDLPEVVGFVEVTSCFLVNVARRKILDAPFADKERGIKWERWDMNTAKKYTNVVARISRCVVYPELRGVGIAAVLTKAAIKFAKSRWHIANLRPSFMEITAEMLRYWPFVEKDGFVKVGETEGNDNRLEKSMTYLLNRQEKRGFPGGGGGIMAMYRAHATLLGKAREERKLSVQDMITLVRKSPEQLSVKDWVALHGIYRRPKPVYMIGLTKDAEAHLRDRMRKNLGRSPVPKDRRRLKRERVNKKNEHPRFLQSRIFPRSAPNPRSVWNCRRTAGNQHCRQLGFHNRSRPSRAGRRRERKRQIIAASRAGLARQWAAEKMENAPGNSKPSKHRRVDQGRDDGAPRSQKIADRVTRQIGI